MSVALGLRPQRALLSDINPSLINFYNWVARGLKISRELKNEREAFLENRRLFNLDQMKGRGNSQDAAELFYYLNRTCFNGLCRFNSKGGFNVPFGSYKKIPYILDFSRHQSVLKKWEIVCQPFSSLPIENEDFLYIDPPYDVEFTTYSKEGFGWNDQIRLVEWLSSHSGPQVVSNQATERIQKLYKDAGYLVRLLSAPRRISSNGNRDAALEILATKQV